MIHYLSYFLNIISIVINIYFYYFVKYLKEKQSVLKNCNFEYNSNKIYFFKHISFVLIPLLTINLFFELHKYILQLPLIGGFYSFIVTIILLIQILSYFRIIKKLKNTNCMKDLKLNEKLYNKIYENQYKIFFLYISIIYYNLFYK